MAAADSKIRVYEELADWEQKHGSPQARDRFLILAADAALSAGQNDEAEKLRSRLLEHNPHHLLRPFSSLAEAMKSSEVSSYVSDMRSNFPLEEAERLLASHRGETDELLPALDKSESAPSGTEAAPTRLPDPPPLETYRFIKDQDESPSAPVAGRDAEPPLFGNLREQSRPSPIAQLRSPAVMRPEPAPVPEAEEEEQREEDPAGISAWISDVLFILIFLVGLALAGYTLARPFLALPDSPFKTPATGRG